MSLLSMDQPGLFRTLPAVIFELLAPDAASQPTQTGAMTYELPDGVHEPIPTFERAECLRRLRPLLDGPSADLTYAKENGSEGRWLAYSLLAVGPLAACHACTARGAKPERERAVGRHRHGLQQEHATP